MLLSTAIEHWDFSHAGRDLPDTVPALAAALAADPALRVLAVSGVHDLATPFHVTETDLARLGSDRVSVRNYPGGHMSFLDDATRPRQKADIAAFLAQAAAERPLRRSPLAAALRSAPAWPALPAWPDRAGVPAAAIGEPLPEAALQAPLRDPWVPARREPGR